MSSQNELNLISTKDALLDIEESHTSNAIAVKIRTCRKIRTGENSDVTRSRSRTSDVTRPVCKIHQVGHNPLYYHASNTRGTLELGRISTAWLTSVLCASITRSTKGALRTHVAFLSKVSFMGVPHLSPSFAAACGSESISGVNDRVPIDQRYAFDSKRSYSFGVNFLLQITFRRCLLLSDEDLLY